MRQCERRIGRVARTRLSFRSRSCCFRDTSRIGTGDFLPRRCTQCDVSFRQCTTIAVERRKPGGVERTEHQVCRCNAYLRTARLISIRKSRQDFAQLQLIVQVGFEPQDDVVFGTQLLETIIAIAERLLELLYRSGAA